MPTARWFASSSSEAAAVAAVAVS
jgi:hypothetical protein